MNTDQWLNDWKEGVALLDNATVRIERMKHQMAYIEQELNRMDADEPKSIYQRVKEWFRR